ncbi:MAG: hypothetical protein WDZ89_01070, partial [Gemmatimonadota bacterium]
REAWEAQKEIQRARHTSALRQQRLEQWLEGLRQVATITDRRAEVFRAADEDAGPQIPMIF